jgi:hypothetical protein
MRPPDFTYDAVKSRASFRYCVSFLSELADELAELSDELLELAEKEQPTSSRRPATSNDTPENCNSPFVLIVDISLSGYRLENP